MPIAPKTLIPPLRILSLLLGQGCGKRERRAQLLRAHRQFETVVLRSGEDENRKKCLWRLLLPCLYARLSRCARDEGLAVCETVYSEIPLFDGRLETRSSQREGGSCDSVAGDVNFLLQRNQFF